MAYLDWSHSGPKRTLRSRNEPPDTILTAEEAELIRERLNSLKLEVEGNAALLVAEALISAITNALSNEGWKSPIGPYPTKVDLQEAVPVGAKGMLAIVGTSPNWGAYVWSDETDEWEVLNDSFEGMLKSEYATGNRPGEVDTSNKVFLRDENDPDPMSSIKGGFIMNQGRPYIFADLLDLFANRYFFEVAGYSSFAMEEYRHEIRVGVARLLVGSRDNDNSESVLELMSGDVANGTADKGLRVVSNSHTELLGALRLLAATAAEVANPADVQDGDRLAVIDRNTGEVVPRLMTAVGGGSSNFADLLDVDFTDVEIGDLFAYSSQGGLDVQKVAPYRMPAALGNAVEGLQYVDGFSQIDVDMLPAGTIAAIGMVHNTTTRTYTVVNIDLPNIATIYRHTVPGDIAIPPATVQSWVSPLGIGGCEASIVEQENPATVTVTTNGAVLTGNASDEVGFFPLLQVGDADFSVTVRLTGDVLTNVVDGSKYGLCARSGLEAGSSMVAGVIGTNSGGSLLEQYERTARNTNSAVSFGGGATGNNVRIKLERVGATVSFYTSSSDTFGAAAFTATLEGACMVGLLVKAGSGTVQVTMNDIRFE